MAVQFMLHAFALKSFSSNSIAVHGSLTLKSKTLAIGGFGVPSEAAALQGCDPHMARSSAARRDGR